MIRKLINRFGSLSKIKFYYQRSVQDFDKREQISKKIASKIGKENFSGSSILDKEYNNSLNSIGFIDFGKIINIEEVNNIKKKLLSLKCCDPYRPELGDFLHKDIPSAVHVANYKRSDLAKIPEIMDIANDPEILKLAQNFLGAKPTISNINCWWSMPNKDQAEQAQFFHRDVDDYKFCKLFLYLTDVTLKSGPHVYVQNSVSSNTLTKIKRYSDKEIENHFGKENVLYFTGDKGSMFMVNTYGFHKGLLPEKEERLLLQVQYSLQDIGIETYNPIEISNIKYDKYVNRLILK